MGRTKNSSSLLLLFVLFVPLARAADLTKIDRSIAKEPAYQKTPQYCLLVFGPEAKNRVWLVLDGDTLYVDRNGNGDLTEQGKRLPMGRFVNYPYPPWREMRQVQAGSISDGGLEHMRLTLTQYKIQADFVPYQLGHEQLKEFIKQNPGALVNRLSILVEHRPKPGDKVRIVGHYRQEAGSDANGYLQFAARRKEAPVIHFNGPLRMGLLCRQVLKRGKKAGDLMTVIGTPGLGDGTFASIDPTGLIREDVHPLAEIEFPHKTPGRPAIRTQVILPYHSFEYYGPLPVPEEAGTGRAKITLSFGDCEEIPVGPAQFEVALEPQTKQAQAKPPMNER